MSLQLIVFPQSYNGMNSFTGAGTEHLVDGINFNTVNTSSSAQSLSGTLPQAYIDVTYTLANTWYRFSDSSSEVTQSSGNAVFVSRVGMLQRLSNLTVGALYDFTIEFNAVNVSGIKFYHYTGTTQIGATAMITGTTTTTLTFTAQSASSDTIALWGNGATEVASLSVRRRPISSSGVSLSNGQVICDLYEDEDIPLTLSVDDFKNVAEQVKSYSKAFKLPATKRNNLIFDNIFEITRADNGVVFNPYVKTQCILKQDGFVLFEGYLRMIDISDKEGEVSYNVNLYSEVVALADILGERTFIELGFAELEHDYNKIQIKESWTGSVTYTNANDSGFRDAETLKYPFVDWTHQFLIANGSTGTLATHGNPELTSLEQAFRPFINIKYLIDRIFNQTAFPFSYTSAFFNTADFKKLYMDFNWGGNTLPTPGNEYSATWKFGLFPATGSNIGTGSYKALRLLPESSPGGEVGSEVPPTYQGDPSLADPYIITAITDNETYIISYRFRLKSTSSFSVFYTANCRWVKNKGLASQQVFNQSPVIIFGGFSGTYTGGLSVILDTGDTLEAQFDSTPSIRQHEVFTSTATFIVSSFSVTSATLTTLRGELGQWEFLKGLMTMFNLVSMPDISDPNNILIEPYNDIFLENSDSSELNWTDKIDIEEIKLTPLTDLNRNTIFKFVEDDDDWAFQNYKNQVEGHLYGSQLFDAETSTSGLATVLSGTEEIVAEPFAATIPKPLMTQYPELIIPAIYAYNPDDDTSEAFDNSPRIMYNNGVVDLSATGTTYYIPAQNGGSSANEDAFLQFSHLTDIPTVVTIPPDPNDTRDFHFGICQLIEPIGNGTPNNLFNTYWLPYYNELYNPDTRTMTIKVNLGAGDINTFKFYDIVMIKNRTFRVNKIEYKPNDLSTVEFILIP
jgi:hypothetical protein